MVKRTRYVFVNDELVEAAAPPLEFASMAATRAPERPLPHGGYVESNGRLIPIGVYL